MILTLVVAGLILAMLPAAAVADPGIVEVNFSEAAYEGYDSFYGTTVVAYRAGSTAKIEFRVSNDSTADLNVKGATATFDWGTTCVPTAPATFPFVLKAGDNAIFRFECVVPADATNQTLHSYKVAVEYEGMAGPGIVNKTNYESCPDWNLNNDVAVPGSVTLWDVTPTGAQAIPVDKYSVSYVNGAISWVAPYPGPTGSLFAGYEYITAWTAGNGVNKVFRFQTTQANLPIVPDSVKVVKAVGAPVSSVTKIDTGWTVDLQTGTVTFTDAPAVYETVGVFFKNYSSFRSNNGAFAVVSVDQADYTTLWRRYMETTAAPPGAAIYASSSALQLRSEADAARLKAEIQYREGDFAGAKASMQIALDKFNASIAAQSALFGSVESGVMGLLTGAGGAVDAYGAKLNAEAKNITDTTKAETNKLNGEADMAKNLGVFYIMLGVATLLAGIGGILWAYSRLVAAKGPKQI